MEPEAEQVEAERVLLQPNSQQEARSEAQLGGEQQDESSCVEGEQNLEQQRERQLEEFEEPQSVEQWRKLLAQRSAQIISLERQSQDLKLEATLIGAEFAHLANLAAQLLQGRQQPTVGGQFELASELEALLERHSSKLSEPVREWRAAAKQQQPQQQPQRSHLLASPAKEDQDQLAIRVANETLKQWHKGLKLPIEPVPGGISEDAVEDWKALKEELGIECSAIDRIVDSSGRTGLPRGSKRRSRFYNIYNTYVYGDKAGGATPSPPYTGLLTNGQFLFCIGASAAVAFLVGSFMASSPQYSIPGGATYYDRMAWSSFNSIQATGEGFPGDGSRAAFWGFLGRLGASGVARTMQNRPT